MIVRLAGGALRVEFATHGDTVDMEDLGKDTFLAFFQPAGHPIVLKFWPGPNGQPQHLASVYGVGERQ